MSKPWLHLPATRDILLATRIAGKPVFDAGTALKPLMCVIAKINIMDMNVKIIVLFSFTLLSIIGCNMSHELDNGDHVFNGNDQQTIIKGVTAKGKYGIYVFADDRINSRNIIAVIDPLSFEKYKKYVIVGKKVELAGYFITNSLPLYYHGSHRATYHFKIMKVLSVCDSQSEKDMDELKKICRDKIMSFSMEDRPVEEIVKAINRKYVVPIISVVPDSAVNRLHITMCLDNITVYDAIIYLLKATNSDVVIKNHKILLNNEE